MQKINDILIPNQVTYEKLTKIFENKKPTKKTVLLLRLYTERNINVNEMMTLNSESNTTTKKGVDFKQKEKDIKIIEKENNLMRNIVTLDQHHNKNIRLIDKLKGVTT